MSILIDKSIEPIIESILPLDNTFDAWGAELPAGMNPLGQSADYDWSNLSWYEMGAISEAVLKMFSPAAIALDRVLTYVISDGFNINPKSGDQKLDDDLEQFYLNVSKDPQRIDYDGESDLMGCCRKLLRGALISGGHFAVFVNRDSAGGNGKVQLIEAYRCKTPYHLNDRERIVGGVQLAPNSRKQIGYWFEEDDAGDWGQYITPVQDNVQYIPSEDESGNKTCVHFRLPGRASATKSDGVMAVALQAIFQHLKIRKNVCTKTEIANAVTLIKEVTPNAHNFDDLAKQINQRIIARNGVDMGLGFKPGQSLLVPAGMTARMETPNVPNQEFFSLDTVLFRELGALFWMSKELIQLNAETGNFSSIRMLMKAAEPGLRFFQNLLAYNFLRHWWSFALRDLMYEDAAIRRAIIRLNYNPHFSSWDFPGWKGLDPEKDFEADNGRMSNGHASDSSVFQERGLNFSKELPRIVGDAWWRMELSLQEVLKPENKSLLDQCGVTTKEAFALLYGRTSPKGEKIVPFIFAQQPPPEEDKTEKKKEESQE